MSAASFVARRLGRRARAAAHEHVAPPPPTKVLISATRGPDASEGSIERLECRQGRIEILLRLEDGSSGSATLFDDDVNWLELQTGGTVFVHSSESPERDA